MRSVLILAASIALLAASVAIQSPAAISIQAHFYTLRAPLDVNAIKAIGSVDTKRSPSILQVSKEEMARVEKVVTDAGGSLVGSPKVLTNVDQAAKIAVDGPPGYSLEVTPSNHGSDTISMKFKLSVSTRQGDSTVTRTAAGSARVQEAKALLIIENPRSGQPGLLTVVEAKRS
ncbi:MAG TPA: hypothetical protein VMI31_18235 [Fimbriimonadaceae bacterium]|nr:hypothetical protein [Fimbriimonadaceae bacterium]